MNLEPFLGRPFVHGSSDCYGLVRDYFLAKHNIVLRDYARPDNWWDHGLDLYSDNYVSEGFSLIHCHPREYRVDDCFLMSIRSSVPNHIGIYLGDGQILHHFWGQLSAKTLYKGIWFNSTVAVIRHKDVKHVQDEQSIIDFRSLSGQAIQGGEVAPQDVGVPVQG